MNPNPNETKTATNDRDMKYLKLLAGNFPTISSVTTEIINLQAILHLPKPTEHFLADLHGENEAFEHVLRNASGNIKRKVRELFGNTLREAEICELCTLIYYPRQKLELMQPEEADRGLLPNHIEQTGGGLPFRVFKIHALKSAQKSPGRVFLYHRGTSSREF